MPAIDENVIKRIMPHSLEAEQSVIGSMFIDTEAIAAATEQISGEDFYNRQYGIVFDPAGSTEIQGRCAAGGQRTGFPDEPDRIGAHLR